ncbi:class I SAM-dependent methyltransferase [Desulfosarcina sp. BuS5]|uniref:class I SAM-dependent methyltransferase n=1 Tax=Desulfosarcina sp. BuS5 TaxID=933262 RepID=UPI0023785533|nr:methyltransferase domain-containing protein [Desulfosarcina sp. BuS5]
MQNEIASILNTKARKENIHKLYEHFATISASLSKEITEVAENITSTKAALGNDIHEVSESLTTTKADLTKEITAVSEELATTNADLSDTQSDLASTNADLLSTRTDLKNDITEISEKLTDTQTDFTKKITAVSEEIATTNASLSKEITEVAENITSTKAALGNDIQNVLESLTTTKADLTREITAVSEELATTNADLSDTQSDLASTNADLLSTRTDLKNDITEISEKLTDTQTDFTKKITAVSEEIATTNASLSKEITEVAEKITSTKAALSNDIHEVSESLTTTKADLTNTQTDFTAGLELMSDDLHSKIASKADKTELKLYLQTVSYAKEYMKISQQNMQNLIDEAKKRLPDEIFNEKELLLLTDEEKHKLDPFYVEFEDRFRGTREDIKKRVEVYLPYLEALPFKKEEIRALDLGCGRGEWLELLGEHGYKAQGIDINRIMVAKSKELGLNVQQADVREYLTSLEEESLSVVTGFHIIEHLPFQILMKMYDEVLRVLKPEGMVIFETPNPENVLVGACNFYTDPTHINPIPPKTTEFLLSKIGFNKIKLERVNKPEDTHYEDPNLNHLFASSMDYSVIGYKI